MISTLGGGVCLVIIAPSGAPLRDPNDGYTPGHRSLCNVTRFVSPRGPTRGLIRGPNSLPDSPHGDEGIIVPLSAYVFPDKLNEINIVSAGVARSGVADRYSFFGIIWSAHFYNIIGGG